MTNRNFAFNPPPLRDGPWRPGGHGPDVVGHWPDSVHSTTCLCGATGVTDWQTHVAEAATREGNA